jgi:hypothetical protein
MLLGRSGTEIAVANSVGTRVTNPKNRRLEPLIGRLVLQGRC